MKYYINTDGGSRGNPGNAAYGFVIKDAHGKILASEGKFMGHATNNEAEYSAVVFGLRHLKNILGDESEGSDVEILADSELLVRQMNGIYKVKNERLIKLFMEVWNSKSNFKSVIFTHVRRAQNKEADAMVNKALDEALFNQKTA